jgi:hypothetical protein
MGVPSAAGRSKGIKFLFSYRYYVFKFFKFVVTLLYNAHYQRAKLQLISDIRHFTAGNFTNPTEFSLHRVSVKEGHKL